MATVNKAAAEDMVAPYAASIVTNTRGVDGFSNSTGFELSGQRRCRGC